MKKTLCLALLLGLVGAMSAFAGQQLDAAAWRGVQTYDLRALQKIEARRSERSSACALITGTTASATRSRAGTKVPSGVIAREKRRNSPFLRVMVAKKDLPAFKSIPTDFQSPARLSFTARCSAIRRRTFSSFACWAAKRPLIRPATPPSIGDGADVPDDRMAESCH